MTKSLRDSGWRIQQSDLRVYQVREPSLGIPSVHVSGGVSPAGFRASRASLNYRCGARTLVTVTTPVTLSWSQSEAIDALLRLPGVETDVASAEFIPPDDSDQWSTHVLEIDRVSVLFRVYRAANRWLAIADVPADSTRLTILAVNTSIDEACRYEAILPRDVNHRA